MTNAKTPGAPPTPDRWPSLPVAEWAPTRDTLQLWTQIVGKVRMVNTPTVNHWWNVPLYLTARGLTSSLIPHQQGPGFQIDFDLQDHQLQIATSRGQMSEVRAGRPLRRRLLRPAHGSARRPRRHHDDLAHARRN